ncbi:hypothetical protein [Butyrivibrio fibrisolvens]|uniref:hypothetical protein n=1 Tax=Butyrivibrio fibrisolvens TaxID=831 RepID=UPI00040AD355|nr:hypothetical protein [Butyrivibrio fibrisolvens]
MTKKWAITFISIFMSVVLLISGSMLVFDPYFHYHAPLNGVSYSVGNEVYKNDGICKNWEYETLVTGTSMTENISIEQVNEVFQTSTVRATFYGEGYRRINDNLITALDHNKDLKRVIRCVDPIWFVCDWDFLEYGSYDAYPTYLYDEDWTNDFSYIFNMNIIRNDLVPMIWNTVTGEPSVSFDDRIIYDEGGIDKVKEKYVRPAKEIKEIDPEETRNMMECLERNIEINLISTIKENPDVSFIIYFPPYGLFFWDSLMQKGSDVVKRRYEMEEYVIQQLLECDNVELYSFLDCFDITTDMNNYVDDLHYTAKISEYIINTIGVTKEHRLTKDNYEEYLERSRSFYLSYDYDSVFG